MKRSRLSRKTPLRPRNPKRRKKEFKRTYGSEERVRWIQSLPCVATGGSPCVNAHVPAADGLPSGMGRKEDAEWIVPLTWRAHQELHQYGLAWFEDHYGVDLTTEAQRIAALWTEEQAA